MARFQVFRHTDRRLTDGQNRLLNPASRMRAQGNEQLRITCLADTTFHVHVQVVDNAVLNQ